MKAVICDRCKKVCTDSSSVEVIVDRGITIRREGKSRRERRAGMKRRNEIRLKWHPFPEEKPKRAKNCMVSISCDGTEYTDSSWWNSKEKQFENYWDSVVTAWAYMPRPYKKKS